MTYSSPLFCNTSAQQDVREIESSKLDTLPVTVLILTKNEEQFIERCLRSVLWADEKLVLDSGSDDRTKEIAATLGAKVYEQEWLGYSGQRNKAISLAKLEWVFFLDADEIVSPELADSIKEVMSGSKDARDGYCVNRRSDFYGILLSNASPPKRRRNFVRLFNKLYSAYDPTMKVHEEVRFPGKTIPLQGILIHWRARLLNEEITAANRYATLEAEVLHDKGYRVNGLIIFLRPILRFLWCYVIHRGFRFGTRGLIHAMWSATAEYIRYAKLWEMQNVTHTLHPPADIYKSIVAEQR